MKNYKMSGRQARKLRKAQRRIIKANPLICVDVPALSEEETRTSEIERFIVVGEYYIQTIDLNNDSVYITKAVSGERMLTIDHSGYIKDQHNKSVGKFCMDNKHNWYFEGLLGGNLISYHINDLLRCEVLFAMEYLNTLENNYAPTSQT